MVQLLYVSRLSPVCTIEALQHILSVSRAHNPEHDITGLLCYDPDFFLQWLEGPRDAVNFLYKNIVGDKRHEDVQIISYADITARVFDQWSMAYISTRDIDTRLITQYCPHGCFEPYNMGGHAVKEFLIAVARAHASDFNQVPSSV
jgi:hypothetical protein